MTDETVTGDTDFTPVQHLTRDLRKAAATMTPDEARFLVDYYYLCQEDRKRSGNQTRSMEKEPHELLSWIFEQSGTLEGQIKSALDIYSRSQPVGQWLRSVHGIGPVIAAGLLAHIDIKQAPTVGHIWAFAGLDPSKTWEKGQKRPWNAQLKTLCWHVGQSFMKLQSNEKCWYAKHYASRKAFEIARNRSGQNSKLALERSAKYAKSTEAYGHLTGDGKCKHEDCLGLTFPHLPPAQIDARARRWAVKLFLSHLHERWYEIEFGKKPPKPYVLDILGHGHLIEPCPYL